MTFLDFLLFPAYAGLFYFLADRTVSKHQDDPIYALYYKRGLSYKIFGSISYVLIYAYYYGGGDTTVFFYAASTLIKLLFSNPALFFKFVLGFYPRYPEVLFWDLMQHHVAYITHGTATLTTIRIAGILNLFCLNSFLCLSMLFGYISYQFTWKLFRLFVSLYPSVHKQLSYAFLMIPSALFWCSGLSKDTIMFSAIAALVYYFYIIFIQQKISVLNIIGLLIAGYLMALIRGFILFSLIPCLLLMAVVFYRNRIGSSFLRFIIGPFFLVAGMGASVLIIRSLGDAVQSYKLDSLEKKAEGFKSWHTTLGIKKGGSSYNLGSDFKFTAGGIARKAPIAAITAMFGPFIWQVRNPVMLLSAVESLVLLYFTLAILIDRKIYRLIGILMGDYVVVFCLPFVLLLAIAIGLTSFNYGALVRYRTPILPFFAVLLIAIRYHLADSKSKSNP